MKEKLDHILEHVAVNAALKEKILHQTVWQGEGADRGDRKRRHSRVRIAAAVLICLLLVPVSAFAGHTIFKGFLIRKEEVKQYVSENVYEDSDEHIKMQVLELLSDEMVAMATVRYEALDAEGKEWLQSEMDEKEEEWPQAAPVKRMEDAYFNLQPEDRHNTDKYGVNYSYGCVELKKYRTDTERYYIVTVEADRWNPSMKNCRLTYLLSGDQWGVEHTTTLNTATNIPVYEYQLETENPGGLGEYCKPTNIRLSKLSYVVYGQEEGFWELTEKQREKYFISHAALLREDGSQVCVEPGWQFGEIDKNSLTIRGSGKYNCAIVSDSLSNIWDTLLGMEKKGEVCQAAPEEFVGIVLANQNGTVKYRFEMQTSH